MSVSNFVQTVLAPVDFSDDSVHAARLAGAMARRCKARLRLVHVDQVPAFATRMAQHASADVWDAYLHERRKALHRRLEELATSLDGDVDVGVAQDQVAAAIVNDAVAQHVGLIVMSAYGLNQSVRRVLGGTVFEVAASSACPVLVSRGATSGDLPREGSFQRPLIALTNEDRASDALALLPTLAKHGARVDLIHLVEPVEPRFGPRLPSAIADAVSKERRAMHARLDKVAQMFRDAGFECSFEVESGPPAGVLVGRVEERGHDLVIVGRKTRREPKRLIGSVAARLLRHSPVPVAVVSDEL